MQSKTTYTRSRPLVLPLPSSDDVLNAVIDWGRPLNYEAPWVEDREVIPLLALFETLYEASRSRARDAAAAGGTSVSDSHFGDEPRDPPHTPRARDVVSAAGMRVTVLVGAGHLDLYDAFGQRSGKDVWCAHFVKLTPFGDANAKLRAFASGDPKMLALVDTVAKRGGQ